MSLGFTREAWAELQAALLELARTGNTESGILTPFGQKYIVRGTIHGPNGRVAGVVTAWIVLNGERVPPLHHRLPRGILMTERFRELDTVVLLRDLPEAGLRSGDIGTVIQVYSFEAFEVEFVTASGKTQALLTLSAGDVRPARDDDLVAVRSTAPRKGAA